MLLDANGARVCDPQRVASENNAENNFHVTLLSTRCGSQSRAPGRGSPTEAAA